MVPHILLEEIGAPYERVFVDRAKGAHRAPDHLKLNPNGLLPVLTDGELVLYETAAIALHLVDTHPQAGLVPALGTPEKLGSGPTPRSPTSTSTRSIGCTGSRACSVPPSCPRACSTF